MNTIKETKNYYLNSNNTPAKNSSFKSDIIFNISNLVKSDKNVLYNNISIIHAEIPYSFYVVNEYNNLLALSTGDIYIDLGNYNANSLMKFLNSKFPIGMSMSLDRSTGKFSITYNSSFTIYKRSTCQKLLGLGTNTDYSGPTVNFPFPANCLGTNNIYIKSPNVILDNYNTSTQDYITLLSIPVAVEPFELIIYSNLSQTKHLLKNKTLDSIEIIITDDNNNKINFNNTDWSITLQIETYINMNLNSTNLLEYLASQN